MVAKMSLSILFASLCILGLQCAEELTGAYNSPVYRYFNGQDHFYTVDLNELGEGKYGYNSEGVGFRVPNQYTDNVVPVYRYYNGVDHFYTQNFSELGEGRGRNGYQSEGIAFYVFPTQQEGTTPLYRYFNGPEHFYTTDANEIGTTNNGQTGKYGYTSEPQVGFVFHA